MADKQEPNAPPRPAEASAGVSANICGSAHQRETNAEAAADRQNDNFQVSVRSEIPTRGSPYSLNFLYDKFYFPTDLCVDWNILHGAPIPSFAFTAAHSRAGETMQNEKVSDVFKRFTFPPTADFSLLSFLHQYPTRVTEYIHFLTPLQEAFSQRVQDLYSVSDKWRTWMLIPLMLGIPTVLCGLVIIVIVELISGGIVVVLGFGLIVCGAVIARNHKRLFVEDLEKKSASLTLCGQGVYENANSRTLSVPRGSQQVQQQVQPQQVRAWHAEVIFEAGAETFSVSANFTISWKACNEQCAQHRACGPLVEVLVNRSTHSDSHSHSSAGPQVRCQ